MFFSGEIDYVIDYAKSQGSTKLTVTGQFVQTDSADVSYLNLSFQFGVLTFQLLNRIDVCRIIK